MRPDDHVSIPPLEVRQMPTVLRNPRTPKTLRLYKEFTGWRAISMSLLFMLW